MAKKKSAAKAARAAESVSSYPEPEPAKEQAPGKPKAHPRASALVDTRVIYCGDNLEQLKKLPDACVDLVYIDPPFNSNRNYEVFWGETKEKRSFDDRHASTAAYIDFMRPRCVELHRVLKPTGSFYYHCDWHADGYVRVMLDQIFGAGAFGTHIIWRRTNAKGLAFKSFPNNHDSIFYYRKGDNCTFNRLYLPHSQQLIDKHYGNIEPETGRRYTLGDLLNPNPDRPNLKYEFLGITKVWRWTKERMQKAYEEGRVIQPSSGAVPRYKRYLDEQEGVPLDSVWTDIPPINSQAKEDLGYPTQKPLALLERIIKASSNPNDVVLDAFCGCGTALVAAETLGRQWIGIDVSPTACRVMAKRLQTVCRMREDENLWLNGRGFVVRNLPYSEAQLHAMPPFEFENWAVNALGGIPNKTKVGDMGIDGRIFLASSTPTRTGKTVRVGERVAEQAEAFMDEWYPIQVKQKDKAGRPDVDSFEAVMAREERKKGFFVAFDFSSDALTEMDAYFRKSGRVIVPLTVKEILEEQLAKKLA